MRKIIAIILVLDVIFFAWFFWFRRNPKCSCADDCITSYTVDQMK